VGAHARLSLVKDGPVTLLVESPKGARRPAGSGGGLGTWRELRVLTTLNSRHVEAANSAAWT